MSAQDSWDLASIPDLADWLFKGLHEFHTAKEYGQQAFALAPIQLNDTDYVSLQVVRQVRTYDRKSLPRLADANDVALRRWSTNYGIKPLLDMIGLVQELGSRSFAEHLSDLTQPAILKRLSSEERAKLVAALGEALIPQSDFRFRAPLYPAFLKLASGPNPLSERVLGRALAALVIKSPGDWQQILRDSAALIKTFTPAESPVGAAFFAIESNLPRQQIIDLFEDGGQVQFPFDDFWMIPWFFGATHIDRPDRTPLTFESNTADSYWIRFASRPDDRFQLKKDNLRRALLTALDQEIARQAGRGPNVAPIVLIRPRPDTAGDTVQEAADDREGDDAQVILGPLKPRSSSAPG